MENRVCSCALSLAPVCKCIFEFQDHGADLVEAEVLGALSCSSALVALTLCAVYTVKSSMLLKY